MRHSVYFSFVLFNLIRIDCIQLPVVYSYRPFEDLDRILLRYNFVKQVTLVNFRRFFVPLDKQRQYLCVPTSRRSPNNLKGIVPFSLLVPMDQNHCNPCRPHKPRGRYLADLFSGSHLQCDKYVREKMIGYVSRIFRRSLENFDKECSNLHTIGRRPLFERK